VETKKRSWKYQEGQFTALAAELCERLEADDNDLAMIRPQGNEPTQDATERILDATKRAENCVREVAELRAECAVRTEETSKVLLESADGQMQARLAEEKLVAEEAELEALETMKSNSFRVQKELIRAKNSPELMAPVRTEKETLADLIGALAPSGNAADGLVKHRKAALKKCLPEQYTRSVDGGNNGVSKKALGEMRKRLEAYAKCADKDGDDDDTRFEKRKVRSANCALFSTRNCGRLDAKEIS